MKNYRSLLAIALTLLMVISIYSMVSNSMSKADDLKELLAEAKALEEEGLFARAAGKYSEAIALDPQCSYYFTVADMYYENGEYESSMAWCTEVMNAFPEESGGYERMIRACLGNESYKDAFKALDTAEGRGIMNERLEQYRREMKALHYVEYIAIQELVQYSGGYHVVVKDEKWGVVSNTGSTILPMRYGKIGPMAAGIAPVCDAEGNWYLTDEEGLNVANISLHLGQGVSDVSLYNDELFAACVNGTYGYYDMEMNQVLNGYENAGAFNAGVAAVQKDGSWMLIDKKGNSINGEQYEDVVLDDRGICCLKNRILAKKDGKYLLLDNEGKRVGKSAFEDAHLPAGSELLAVKTNGLWGFVDIDGKTVIDAQYENAQSFSNGMAAVCVNGLWGFIDEGNVMCIEPAFLRCGNMTNSGTAFVETNRGWMILKLYSHNY